MINTDFTDGRKTASERGTQKKAEATGDLIDNKAANKVTQNFLQNSETGSQTKEKSIGIPKIYNLQKKDSKLLMI